MRLRTKALILIVVFACVVCAACAWRAYSDSAEAQREAAAAAEPSDAEREFGISPLNEKVTYLLGGDGSAAELGAQVAKWCTENVDGAKSAEWDGNARCDFNAGSVELGFALDDDARTRIAVRAFPETGRFVIEKAVS